MLHANTLGHSKSFGPIERTGGILTCLNIHACNLERAHSWAFYVYFAAQARCFIAETSQNQT